MIAFATPLQRLRANSSDQFENGARYLYPSGRPITRLRYLGQQDGQHFYAAADDAAATLPPAKAAPPAPHWSETLPAAVGYPDTLNGALLRIRSSTAQKNGHVILDRSTRGGYRIVEVDAGVLAHDITIGRLKAEDIFRCGVRVRGDRWHIHDVILKHGAHRNTGRDLPEGIEVHDGTGHLFEDFEISGFYMADVPGQYTNGDCIATEGGTGGIVRRGRCIGASDGGMDLKGIWYVDDCYIAECNRALRAWDEVTVGTLRIHNPAGAALWLAKNAKLTVERLIVTSDRPCILFRSESGGHLTVKSADLSGVAPGSTLKRQDGSGVTWDLSPGCVLP
ncbi:hypothetical protein [Methylobacterium iners]|uniref:Uncharacterized protein n=1 Tax=Methylobacterium iners TaxID=418707 RepID=A0ABQ4RQ79_9HYPH|nr:hypothetical protein [Methylobacterium iners]GJD92921.1 hypothetical protein OCOJLMKI_0104 [Methylobacterium iners]